MQGNNGPNLNPLEFYLLVSFEILSSNKQGFSHDYGLFHIFFHFHTIEFF